jgi:SPP1 family predicted phage head-tail adaptor
MPGNPGLMNRRLTIQERVISKDGAGGRVESWVDAFKVWAQLVSDNGKESKTAEADRSQQMRRFRIRYQSTLTAGTHRVLYKLAFYDIEGIEEEGIQDRQVLTCRAVQSLTT